MLALYYFLKLHILLANLNKPISFHIGIHSTLSSITILSRNVSAHVKYLQCLPVTVETTDIFTCPTHEQFTLKLTKV